MERSLNCKRQVRQACFKLNTKEVGRLPIFTLEHDVFEGGSVTFLIDTGSQLNLLKRTSVTSDVPINTDIIYNLTGIGSRVVPTYGEVILQVYGQDMKFQVIDEAFPIKEMGILGIPFLEKEEATLIFKSTVPNRLQVGDREFILQSSKSFHLPPRMKTLTSIPVKNARAKTGYLSKLDIKPGVYIGDALVSQENGFAKIFAINTTADSVTIDISPVELEEFQIKSPAPRLARTGDPGIRQSEAEARRLVQLFKNLHLSDLSDAEQASILEIINEFPYQFYLPSDTLGSTNTIQHAILTTDKAPINTKQYRYPSIHKEEIRSQIDSLLKGNIIQPSMSPYNSPVWIVPKKSDRTGKPRWRMVIDYRRLNEKAISDAYPLLNIIDILDQLGAAKYFSTLDLASGFHQIPMDPESKFKTAFSTPNGHYEFNRMPFGLKNAPATFQRCMDLVLSGLQGVELFVYMDDIVIYANSLEAHTHKLKVLLARLQMQD